MCAHSCTGNNFSTFLFRWRCLSRIIPMPCIYIVNSLTTSHQNILMKKPTAKHLNDSVSFFLNSVHCLILTTCVGPKIIWNQNYTFMTISGRRKNWEHMQKHKLTTLFNWCCSMFFSGKISNAISRLVIQHILAICSFHFPFFKKLFYNIIILNCVKFRMDNYLCISLEIIILELSVQQKWKITV